jgi:hypothetical protein
MRAGQRGLVDGRLGGARETKGRLARVWIKSSPYRSGRLPYWLKMKNPACAAVNARGGRGLGNALDGVDEPTYHANGG